jgi:Zn-dependent protease
VAALIALTVHEYCHGYAAYKLGDNTARNLGRLSLNPLHHLDLFGVLCMMLFHFGWAKPVPINARNFRKPKRDFALCSIAGPIANFILAFVSTLLFTLTLYIMGMVDAEGYGITFEVILLILQYSIAFNIGLGLFNLIPIPPLDGSNVLMCVLPNRLAAQYSKIRYYTRHIFLILIISSWLQYPLSMINDIVFKPLDWLNVAMREFFFEIAIKIFDVFG